jgi:hypothetical protein
MPGHTMSDWMNSLKSAGQERIANLYQTSRIEDDKRLLKSGLPVYDRILVSYQKFSEQNRKVARFLSKYQSYVIRALPKSGEGLRRPKIGLKNYKECRDFLDSLFEPGGDLHGKEREYVVSLVEHEPAIGSGVIISNLERTVIEISEQGLDDLSHGKISDAIQGIYDFHGIYPFREMRYSTEDPKKIELMQRAIDYIRNNPLQMIWQFLKNIPPGLPRNKYSIWMLLLNLEFKTGYFEFVITKSGRIFFWDFKTNPAYTKI